MNQAEFFEAVRRQDLDAVLSACKADPSLVNCWNPIKDDGPSWDEIYPLHVAAKGGNLDLVKALVALGAEVYSNPRNTYPAVMLASWEGHDEIVDYFLNEIPLLANGTNGIGVACNLAGRRGWSEIVRKHIAKDPLVVHERGWIGDTPLHWPAHNGYIEIVQMLLDAGADPNVEENNWIGGTPLHWASERHPEIIRLLVQHSSDVNSRVTKEGSSMLGATPLIWCAKQNDDSGDAAQTLLDLGADPSALDAEGKTAKDWANELGNKLILKTLSS